MHDGPDETHPNHDSGRINSADVDEDTLDKDSRPREKVVVKREDVGPLSDLVAQDIVGDDMISVHEPPNPMRLLNPKTGEYEEAIRIAIMDKGKNKYQFWVPKSAEEEAMDTLTKLVGLGAVFGGATPQL